MHIGIQIKPVNQGIQIPRIHQEKRLQLNSHKAFQTQHGGQVFYIYSTKADGKKKILNVEVVDEIRAEIKRLEP